MIPPTDSTAYSQPVNSSARASCPDANASTANAGTASMIEMTMPLYADERSTPGARQRC